MRTVYPQGPAHEDGEEDVGRGGLRPGVFFVLQVPQAIWSSVQECKVTMPVLTLARYILELSLMEYGVNVDVSESEVAAGCLVLAFKMKGIKVEQ